MQRNDTATPKKVRAVVCTVGFLPQFTRTLVCLSGLVFAAAHFDLTNRKHLEAVRRVFQLWERGDHISFDSGTGMLGQLRMALQVWEHKGFDWRSDPVLGPIIIPLQRQ